MSAVLTAERHEQRMVNLVRANVIRIDRAELKRRIAAGTTLASDVLLCLPPEAESWAVGKLLVSQRRWGASRARGLLAGLRITETRALGSLTARQRRMLAESLLPKPELSNVDVEVLGALGGAEGWVQSRDMGLSDPRQCLAGVLRSLARRGLILRSPTRLRFDAFGWRLTELGSVELAAVMGTGG